ncbi:hypothetical protein [Novosphingobium sp. TCA1]|jgi:hypothetical protein|uniref:hypothetical protein n=1 Tax=Novosphingobium sp. TCA1 TaxID=2682474 RepID=UPI00130789AB|nr:hypothetical protein [Novosphingobium sp. TCA1]GFE72372.1 hypothetical protein NTCA1_00210 [Novosphingobium sp. TCA1]
MALKSRLGTGVFQFDDNEIKLLPSLDRLKNLSEATGEEALDYMANCGHPMRLTELFFHLQTGSAYTREEIYAAFFGKLGNFEDEEFNAALMTLFSQMAGKDLAEAIKPATDTQKK